MDAGDSTTDTGICSTKAMRQSPSRSYDLLASFLMTVVCAISVLAVEASQQV